MKEEKKLEQAEVNETLVGHPKYGPRFTSSSLALELTETESEIFEIAKDLMKKHYVLKIGDLTKRAFQSLKDKGKKFILLAINSLIRKKFFFEGKALHKGSILENQTRKRIYNMIKKEPGMYAYKIRSKLELDSRSVALHLGLLKKFGLIRSTDFDKNRVYFAHDLDTDEFDFLYYYLQKKYVLDIFTLILEYPGLSFKKLFDLTSIEITRGSLLRRINTLIGKGFLTAMLDSNRIKALNLHSKYKTTIINYIQAIRKEHQDSNRLKI